MQKGMQVGVKVGDWNPDHAERMNEYADFFEIYAKPGFDIDLKRYGKPVVVHVVHFGSKINFANSERRKINEEALDYAKRLADKHGSEKIIFHPELDERDGFCSLENIVDFVGSRYDGRLLIENMPYSSQGLVHYCSDPNEVEAVTNILGIEFCLDFLHLEAFTEKQRFEFRGYVERFLRLNPKHFHLADGNLKNVNMHNYDEKHASLFEGDVDLELAKYYIPSNAMVTLETPFDAETQIKEIKWLKS